MNLSVLVQAMAIRSILLSYPRLQLSIHQLLIPAYILCCEPQLVEFLLPVYQVSSTILSVLMELLQHSIYTIMMPYRLLHTVGII